MSEHQMLLLFVEGAMQSLVGLCWITITLVQAMYVYFSPNVLLPSPIFLLWVNCYEQGEGVGGGASTNLWQAFKPAQSQPPQVSLMI